MIYRPMMNTAYQTRDYALQSGGTNAASPGGLLVVGIGASGGNLDALQEFLQHMPADSGMAFVIVLHQCPYSGSLLRNLLAAYTAMPVREATEGMRLEPGVCYFAPADRYLFLSPCTLLCRQAAGAQDIRFPINVLFHSLAVVQAHRAIGIVFSGTAPDGILGLRAIQGVSGLAMIQEPLAVQDDRLRYSALATACIDVELPPSAMPQWVLAYAHSLDGEARESVGLPLDKELLRVVTHAFRDSTALDTLSTRVLLQSLQRKAADEPIRVWVPDCGTGEDAYVLGVLLTEGLERIGKTAPVRIFATDPNQYAIETARCGIFPEELSRHIRSERLARFFRKQETGYRIVREIRSMFTFGVHTLGVDAPFTSIDLLYYRHLLGSMAVTLQQRLLDMFHKALVPDGFIFLHPSERLSSCEDLFTVVDTRWQIFRRHGTPMRRVQQPDAHRETMIDKLLVAQYAPPCVVINEQGDVVYQQGGTDIYLEPLSGQRPLNVFAMASEGLGLHLRAAIRHVMRQEHGVIRERVRITTKGGTVLVYVTVQKIVTPEALRNLLLVSFETTIDVAGPLQVCAPQNAPVYQEALASLHAEATDNGTRHSAHYPRMPQSYGMPGEPVGSPPRAGPLGNAPAATDRPWPISFSSREFQVLRLLATGCAMKEIAYELSLSIKTVSTYRARLLKKLSLHTTADLIRYALQHGLAE